MSLLLEILSPDFLLRNALYGGLIIGFVAPLVGVYLVGRRMVFLGVALPQVSTAGVAGAFFWHALFHQHEHHEGDFWLALSGSTVFTLAAILALAVWENRNRVRAEERTGVLYAFAGALSLLLVASDRIAEIGILGLLKGEIIAIPTDELLVLAVGYAVIVAALWVFKKDLLLVSADRDLARSFGKKVLAWDLVLYLIIGTTISLGVLLVGPLVMFGFLIVPPLIAGRLTTGIRHLPLAASLFGGLTAFVGFAVSYKLDWPMGPTDVALVCLVLALVVTAQTILGWLRRA
ncbi:MAG: metal ABC transporter permease [Nitrospirota bacterium]